MKLTTDQEAIRDAYKEWTENIGMNENNLQYVFTPYSLCEEMVGKLKENTGLKKKNILVFNLEFAIVLMEQGVLPENITFLTDCTEKVKFAEYLGVAVMQEDFKKIIDEKRDLGKFDVVVGNPPYQDQKGTENGAKSSSFLWAKFVVKAIDDLLLDNGYLLFITPISWMSPGKQLIRNQCIFDYFYNYKVSYVDITPDKYFNVGSTFSFFIIQKANGNQTCLIKNSLGQFSINYNNLPCLPNDLHPLTISIAKKTIFSSKDKCILHVSSKTRSDNSDCQSEKSETHIYPVWHTNTKILWFSIQPDSYGKRKIILNSTGLFSPFYDDGEYGTSQITRWIEVDTAQEGEKILSLLNSKLFKYVFSKFRWSGAASKLIFECIPIVKNNVDSDEKIYSHFNLTQEEIDLIESTVKEENPG